MIELEALATYVTDGPINRDGTCQAWVESAERRCGKSAEVLCARHETVARRRHDNYQVELQRRRERVRAAREAGRPKAEAELNRIEARIRQLDPEITQPFDHGFINTPLAKRMPTDSQISELADLVRRRDRLRSMWGMEA